LYYFLLFIGVISFLSFMAWRQPGSPRHVLARAAGAGGQCTGECTGHCKGQSALAIAAGGDWDRLMQSERKDDAPCLTTVDCVRIHQCAGHCGWR
jgi:hypothetical protein